MPKYFHGDVEKIRYNGKYIDVITRNFVYQKQNMILNITPAKILLANGISKDFLPSAREEIIEDVLRKFATDPSRHEFLDNRLTVKFTLYDLWKELRKIKAFKNFIKEYTLIKEKAEKSDVFCADDLTADRMRTAIDKAAEEGDTLGGKFEVIFGNLPIGLGSYVHWDQCLDGRIAQSVMSIPGVKAVEVGAGVDAAHLKGSQMHDELFVDKSKHVYRQTNNAGGIEGGMTNGESLIIKGTMKAIPTMKKSLATIDIKNMTPATAHFERSDTCAVPACSIVAEARVAIILVDEFLSKIGGDNLLEMKAHYGC